MKKFLNIAIAVSFFSLVAATIWLVWDHQEVALNTLKTAAIVFGAALLCKKYGLLQRSCDDELI